MYKVIFKKTFITKIVSRKEFLELHKQDVLFDYKKA